ncbi:hypothetical protein JK361_35110 [Streptomyces sp. 5-8]|uniref:Uncharacterized protein n=1 Tax=Streptomyces musisoli TaxID=2802280 RepID=A0ABS1PCG4_9ACTN|nr:hypothetical protein [Streptomyces musisoli]MBL1109747.1 hypothetical protein [Streptomyces musisoli]MBY8847106.1 hypothetical protein [Streptomyces sp. SP2-10]
MTTVSPAVSRLPADPSLISLVYHHEHPVQASKFGDTLEVWTVSARIDADMLAEDMAIYSDVDQETLDALEDVPVGRMSFVRVRMFGVLTELNPLFQQFRGLSATFPACLS